MDKFNYYKQQVDESKISTKILWRVINNVIVKNKNKGSTIHNTTITNEFRNFYSGLGASLAKNKSRRKMH